MMNIKIIVILFSVISFSHARRNQKKQIKYEYKKYERFDFDSIDVTGSRSNPGDLSLSPRFSKKFRNKIPNKKNFNREMIKALDSIR